MNPFHEIHAVFERHQHIHEHEARSERRNQLHRLKAIGGFLNIGNPVRLPLDQQSYGFTHA